MQQAKPRQKLFGFMYKKKKESIQPLLGKTQEFQKFFKLGNKLFAESHDNIFLNVIEIKPSGRYEKIGSGSLWEPSTDVAESFPSIKNKNAAEIHYALDKKEYGNKGIAKNIVKSLIGLAKEAGFEIIVARTNPRNIESMRVLESNRFKPLPGRFIWHRNI